MTLFIILSIAAFFYFTVSFFYSKRKTKLLNQAKKRTISEAENLSIIQGKIDSPNEIKSLYSKTNCVYYDLIIEYWYTSRKRNEWLQLTHFKDYIPFFLKDDSGKLLIDMANAETDLYYFLRKEIKNLKNNTEEYQKISFLKNQLKFKLPENKEIRISEKILQINDPITIIADIKKRNTQEQTEDLTEDSKNLIQSCQFNEFKIASKIENENFFYLSDSSAEKLKKSAQKSKLLNLLGSILSLTALIIFIIIAKK